MMRWTMTALVSLAVLTGCMSPKGDTVEQKRQTVQQMRTTTLAQLYKVHPFAKTQIRKSVGYASTGSRAQGRRNRISKTCPTKRGRYC